LGWYQVGLAEARAIWPNCFKQANEQTGAPSPGWADMPGNGVMSDEQARQHLLLWDLADEAARPIGQTAEWHWLRYIAAFLRGDLAPRGIVHFYANYDDAAPRAYVRFSPDQLRAKIEIEARRADLTIETLLNWRWKDYRKNLSEFRRKPKNEKYRQKDYFIERDPSGRLGLFVRHDEFVAWQARASAHDGTNEAVQGITAEIQADGSRDERVEAAEASLPISMPRPRVQESELKDWYREHINKHLDCGTTTNGDDDWEAAKNKFGDRVRQAQIRKLRQKDAPAAWRKQGRRPARKIPSNNSVK
jgi:hypothetical protein